MKNAKKKEIPIVDEEILKRQEEAKALRREKKKEKLEFYNEVDQRKDHQKNAAIEIVEKDPDAFFNRDLRRELLEKAQSLGLCDKLDPVTINEIARAATLEYYNSRIYEEVLPDLNKILKIYKNVATELGITNQLDLAQLYTYMIDKGYYSHLNLKTFMT